VVYSSCPNLIFFFPFANILGIWFRFILRRYRNRTVLNLLKADDFRVQRVSGIVPAFCCSVHTLLWHRHFPVEIFNNTPPCHLRILINYQTVNYINYKENFNILTIKKTSVETWSSLAATGLLRYYKHATNINSPEKHLIFHTSTALYWHYNKNITSVNKIPFSQTALSCLLIIRFYRFST